MIDYTEYIKENVSIIDIVERVGVNLKHNKACCPFHHEKTPSFSVHPKKNIFKCFGCGVGGDVIEFTKLLSNCFHRFFIRNDYRVSLYNISF